MGVSRVDGRYQRAFGVRQGTLMVRGAGNPGRPMSRGGGRQRRPSGGEGRSPRSVEGTGPSCPTTREQIKKP